MMLALACCTALSCAKNNNDGEPANLLEGTRWQATLIDENQETNPSGANLYYPWQDCYMDDTFIFKSGHLSIDDNRTTCDDGSSSVFKKSNQSYAYDSTSKLLIFGTGDESVPFQVYELNEDRLKIGFKLPYGTGFNSYIFLFKKK